MRRPSGKAIVCWVVAAALFIAGTLGGLYVPGNVGFALNIMLPMVGGNVAVLGWFVR